MKIKAINGFKDILPDDVPHWRKIETTARDIFRRFGLREIRLPIIEKTELFARSIGEATDIVEKEMYTFADKGITLRPEATASLLRAYIEHGMHVQQPVQRLFTMGPMFRHERPQKGRQRQFHQISVEIIGAQEAQIDAELMAMAQLLLTELGLEVSLEVNSLGCPVCRPDFRTCLVKYLKNLDGLCDDCKRRTNTNPLRVLDCKNRACKTLVQDAPSIIDSLCPECDSHFSAVQAQLNDLGVIYTLNRFMVRGLDYYTRTTFELITDKLGSQSAVAAGGRYDGLIEQLGGPKNTPGIGFALGMERLVLLMEQQEAAKELSHDRADLFAAALGEKAVATCAPLVHALRKFGLYAAMDYSNRSLKAQMKQAGRVNARFALIVGEQELEKQEAVLRNMDTQVQSPFSLQGTAEKLAEDLARLIVG